MVSPNSTFSSPVAHEGLAAKQFGEVSRVTKSTEALRLASGFNPTFLFKKSSCRSWELFLGPHLSVRQCNSGWSILPNEILNYLLSLWVFLSSTLQMFLSTTGGGLAAEHIMEAVGFCELLCMFHTFSPIKLIKQNIPFSCLFILFCPALSINNFASLQKGSELHLENKVRNLFRDDYGLVWSTTGLALPWRAALWIHKSTHFLFLSARR